jgi:hypothetical protein
VTVLSDLIGAVSLVVILYAGLTLPAFL